MFPASSTVLSWTQQGGDDIEGIIFNILHALFVEDTILFSCVVCFDVFGNKGIIRCGMM